MPKQELSQLNVLVIEDEEFMRNIMVRLLYELPVKSVIAAADGMDAQRKLELHKPDVDLIICDLLMPNISGLQFVKLVRDNKTPCNPEVSVLLLTGVGSEEVVLAAAGVGINGYLKKPVSQKVLKQRVLSAMASPMVRISADDISDGEASGHPT